MSTGWHRGLGHGFGGARVVDAPSCGLSRSQRPGSQWSPSAGLHRDLRMPLVPPSPCSLSGQLGHREGLGNRQDQARLKGLFWGKPCGAGAELRLHGAGEPWLGREEALGSHRHQSCWGQALARGSWRGSRAGAAQLQQSHVLVSATGAGTGREGRKRRKSRNGCMVSTGFPVPPQELELHSVQTAPALAPGGLQNQPNGSDLAAHTGQRGRAPGDRDPFVGRGGLSPGPLQGHRMCQGTSCPAQRRVPAPSCSCCSLAARQGTPGLQLGPVGLPMVLGTGTHPGLAPYPRAQRPVLLLLTPHPCPGPQELLCPSVSLSRGEG